jgi:hypothetical protein
MQSDTAYDQPLVRVATVHKLGSARTASHVKSQPPDSAQYASIDFEQSNWQPAVIEFVQATGPRSLLQPFCADARINDNAKVRDRSLVSRIRHGSSHSCRR